MYNFQLLINEKFIIGDDWLPQFDIVNRGHKMGVCQCAGTKGYFC